MAALSIRSFSMRIGGVDHLPVIQTSYSSVTSCSAHCESSLFPTRVVLRNAFGTTKDCRKSELGSINSIVSGLSDDLSRLGNRLLPKAKEEREHGSVDLMKEDSARVLDVEREASRVILPPRYATLRAFGETRGDGVMTGNFEGTSVFELLSANIEASARVRNFEILSGRLAMLAFFVAIGSEIITGNSVFKGIDFQKLLQVAALSAIATLSAGGFAYVWRSKGEVASLMSKRYKSLMDSALDNLIDGLFFDESS